MLLGKRESWALKPGIQPKESGIGSSIQIPLKKTGIQYMETVLDPLLIYMEREYASFKQNSNI